MAKGFTLIEILVSLALLTVLAGLGLFVSIQAYQGGVSRSEQSTIVVLLERARSRAMANVGESPWGVCVVGREYILFKGAICVKDSNSESTSISQGADVSGLNDGITFAQLSGDSNGGAVTVAQAGRTQTVSINHAGAIIW